VVIGELYVYHNSGVFCKNREGCKEGVSYWDDGGNEFDKNLNLISTN